MSTETIQAWIDINPRQIEGDHLRALWHDLHDDWDTAHSIVQVMSDTHAQWTHAYLHRKEGDIANSKYWYRTCGRPYPGNIGFDEEVAAILSELP